MQIRSLSVYRTIQIESYKGFMRLPQNHETTNMVNIYLEKSRQSVLSNNSATSLWGIARSEICKQQNPAFNKYN